jgi:branched-chain amino acid transport system ATP-binding protein
VTQAPALGLQALHKRFGTTKVVCGVDLCVQAGERVALIGPNGAGKSTLFNLISGHARPSSGFVHLHGRSITGLQPFAIARLGLARSFQISNLFPQLSVYENLRCSVLWSLGYGYTFVRLLGSLREATARTDALLERVGLTAQAQTTSAHLPYAQQRALELGITLGSGADVVLLDEPTAGMNRAEAAHFTALIRSATAGKTLLLVEHDMDVVADLADKIAVLVQGRIIAFGPPQAVRADPAVQAAYLGTVV